MGISKRSTDPSDEGSDCELQALVSLVRSSAIAKNEKGKLTSYNDDVPTPSQSLAHLLNLDRGLDSSGTASAEIRSKLSILPRE